MSNDILHPKPDETTQSDISRSKGPWTHRVAFLAFTGLLGILSFWLISFVLEDVSNRAWPDRQAIEAELLDPALRAQAREIDNKLFANDQAITQERQRQQVLRDSTADAQRTMNQLLDFQRIAIDKGITPSADEQQALAESQRLFLDNQQKSQAINQQVAQLEESRHVLETQRREAADRLRDAEIPVDEEYDRQLFQHRWETAALKLALLLPLLGVAVLVWRRARGTLYVYLAYAFAAAVGLHLAIVMHDCFPEEYFRYVLIGASLMVVVRILVFLIRQVAKPKTEWLLRQYREAYERFVCPVCAFPIRRGALKYLGQNRNGPNAFPAVASTADDGPYTCPHCTVRLFEECPTCHHHRHALLPACEACGATKPIEQIVAEGV